MASWVEEVLIGLLSADQIKTCSRTIPLQAVANVKRSPMHALVETCAQSLVMASLQDNLRSRAPRLANLNVNCVSLLAKDGCTEAT